MDLQDAIRAVTEHRNLAEDEMTAVMRTIMTGAATPAQIGGFLVGLRMKGETVEEIAAAAGVMRELSTRVSLETKHVVDTCGTGGDASGTFNISTAAAFVVAAAGGHVAKHGNRSVSSRSGSADLLELAGARLDLEPEQMVASVRQHGVGFMFAPQYHAAMKHAVGPRREMGVRTLFNLLGPLTNPASAPNQLLGVYSVHWLRPMAEVLQRLGSQRVLVVNAEDGLDEISIAAPTRVAELRDGVINEYTLRPEDVGIDSSDLTQVQVTSAEESLHLIQTAFDGQEGPAADMVALNAGAAIYAAGIVDELGQGVKRAKDILISGAAANKLASFVQYTRQFAPAND